MTDEELKNKCKERAKIFQQAMESCKSSSPMDCIEWLADRIAELEKENADLKEEINKIAFARGNLEKENAELKARIDNLKDEFEYSENYGKRVQKERHRLVNDNAKLRDKLTKAKEIIKGWLGDFYNPKAFYQQRAELVEQSEQFLKEE